MTYLPEIQMLRIVFPVVVDKGDILFKYHSKEGLDFTIPIQQLARFYGFAGVPPRSPLISMTKPIKKVVDLLSTTFFDDLGNSYLFSSVCCRRCCWTVRLRENSNNGGKFFLPIPSEDMFFIQVFPKHQLLIEYPYIQ